MQNKTAVSHCRKTCTHNALVVNELLRTQMKNSNGGESYGVVTCTSKERKHCKFDISAYIGGEGGKAAANTTAS